MPFCPNCQKEYETGASRCTDCDVELVESALAEDDRERDEDATELVELAAFANSSEADMIQELLETNGIRTVLRGEVDPIGVVSGAAPSTLLVEKADLSDARKFYDDFFAGETEDTEEESDE